MQLFVTKAQPAGRAQVHVTRMRRAAYLAAGALFLAASLLAGCHHTASAAAAGGVATLTLSSPEIQDGRIPKILTCDGVNTSPQLVWSAPPQAAKSLAFIVTDPDAPGGTFTHWVLFNLPATARSLPSGIPQQPQLADGSSQGRNDFGDIGYGGPCPPHHSEHRYVFMLYALDAKLNLPPSATRKQVEEALQSHILARGELTALYSR